MRKRGWITAVPRDCDCRFRECPEHLDAEMLPTTPPAHSPRRRPSEWKERQRAKGQPAPPIGGPPRGCQRGISNHKLETFGTPHQQVRAPYHSNLGNCTARGRRL